MPLLSFSLMRNKLDREEKLQTIRVMRKRPFKVGDKLFIYWKCRTKYCEKLGEAVVRKVVTKHIGEFTPDDAHKDGFEHLYDLVQALHKLHHGKIFRTKFQVITFEWTHHKVERQIKLLSKSDFM